MGFDGVLAQPKFLLSTLLVFRQRAVIKYGGLACCGGLRRSSCRHRCSVLCMSAHRRGCDMRSKITSLLLSSGSIAVVTQTITSASTAMFASGTLKCDMALPTTLHTPRRLPARQQPDVTAGCANSRASLGHCPPEKGQICASPQHQRVDKEISAYSAPVNMKTRRMKQPQALRYRGIDDFLSSNERRITASAAI